MFIYFIFQINTRTLSTINTAAHASSATVIRVFSLFDLVFCKSEGQHTDEIGDCCHHQDIEIYIMTHEMLPPSLPPDRNKLPGLLPEVL